MGKKRQLVNPLQCKSTGGTRPSDATATLKKRGCRGKKEAARPGEKDPGRLIAKDGSR